MRAVLLGPALLGVTLLSGCQGDCVKLPESCTPQYNPSSFEAVYANTISGSCALSGCHAGAVGQGGLALGSTEDDAYKALSVFIVPGDAACSELIDHLEPAGLGDMPPGATLAEEERCAVRQWIDAGAPR